MKPLFDITFMFWDLIDNIIRLDYSAFKQTEMYDTLNLCVIRDYAFVLDIDGATFIHNGVNALFYDTLVYLESKEQGSARCEQLRLVINKITEVITNMDAIESITTAFGSLDM